MVPLPRDWRSEAQANLVPQLRKSHPSDPIIKKLQTKRHKYYQVGVLPISLHRAWL